MSIYNKLADIIHGELMEEGMEEGIDGIKVLLDGDPNFCDKLTETLYKYGR